MIDNNGSNAINIVPGAAAHLTNKDIDKNLEILKKSKIFLTQMETPDEVTIYSLKKAKQNNAQILNGYSMLVNQALKAWDIWNS